MSMEKATSQEGSSSSPPAQKAKGVRKRKGTTLRALRTEMMRKTPHNSTTHNTMMRSKRKARLTVISTIETEEPPNRLFELALVATNLLSPPRGTPSVQPRPLQDAKPDARIAKTNAQALAAMTFPRTFPTRDAMVLWAGSKEYPEAQQRYFVQANPMSVPFQVLAKGNASILLAGYPGAMSLNCLLAIDNHVIEALLPPPVISAGFHLGHPTLDLIKATLVALTAHLTDEALELAGMRTIVKVRTGEIAFTAKTLQAFITRARRGTTRYMLDPKLAALFLRHNIPWPGRAISPDAINYLQRKYKARRVIAQDKKD